MWNEGGCSAGLGTWALFVEQELPTGLVHTGVVEVDDDLEGEDGLAEKIAMQRVPVPLAVRQQNRRRPGLTGGVAQVQPLLKRVGPWGLAAELGPPVPRNRRQPRVERQSTASTRSEKRSVVPVTQVVEDVVVKGAGLPARVMLLPPG